MSPDSLPNQATARPMFEGALQYAFDWLNANDRSELTRKDHPCAPDALAFRAVFGHLF